VLAPSRQRLLLVAATLFPFASAGAQVEAWLRPGEAGGDALGETLATCADRDGDGVPELLAGAPRSDFAGPSVGRVYVLSGATGAVLERLDGTMNSELYGDALARVEDLDGDGWDDWMVGAPWASIGAARTGRAEARSGRDGSLLLTVDGFEPFSFTGSAVAGLGDANGDGTPDVLVCAPFEDSNGIDSGSVSVHSGVNGVWIRTHPGDLGGDRLGVSALSLGDVDGDGVGDYGAGTPHGNGGLGLLRVWSGQTGAVVYTRLGTELDAGFASAAASVGDLTGDGRREVAIGVPASDLAGTDAGFVLVINGSTGAFVRQLPGAPGERLGASVADAGDWNGDGTPDVLAGAPGATGGGAAYLFSGLDGALLATFAPEAIDEELGSSVTGAFDVDGDGRSEVAAGGRLGDGAGTDSGLVRAWSDHGLLGLSFCAGDGSGASCPCGNSTPDAAGCANSSGQGAKLDAAGSASVATDDLELFGSQLPPGRPTLAIAGTADSNGGAGLPFGDGLRCVGGTPQYMGVKSPGAGGDASWGPGLAAHHGWISGDALRFQLWYRDTVGSPCGAGFNASQGLRVSLLP